ncbi:MAG: VapC toxin family PIN domain ribonuclease, partial [Saprospiraceae bacterium]
QCEAMDHFEVIESGIKIKSKFNYSFYDSLIIAAAISLHCNILYSEDMHHSQKIQGLTIINPFI